MKIKRKQFNISKKRFNQNALSSDEKQSMLSNIYNQYPVGIVDTALSPFGLSPFGKKVFAPAFVAVFLFSGVSYASAKSLPGEALYGFKIHVLESVILSLHVTNESKHEYKTKLVQERIAEVETLKREQKFDVHAQKESSIAISKVLLRFKDQASVGTNIDHSLLLEYFKINQHDIDTNTQKEKNSQTEGAGVIPVEATGKINVSADDVVEIETEGTFSEPVQNDSSNETNSREDSEGELRLDSAVNDVQQIL